MPSSIKTLIGIVLMALLAACGAKTTGSAKVQSAAAKPAIATPRRLARPAPRRIPPPAQILAITGLERVIGATSADLIRQFGPARLDVWEGDARKLQFSGSPCVLDIYLYPAAKDREPQATYLDARRSDGRDVDRAACVAALRVR